MIVGFKGGPRIKEVGPRFDMWAFFEAVAEKLENDDLGSRFPLVGDRLYKRYIRLEEMESVKEEMDIIKSELEKIYLDNWLETKLEPDETIEKMGTRLNLKAENLADLFEPFFSGFYKTYETALFFHKEDNEYYPLKIVYTDLPYYAFDKRRPLEDYENLEGDPFWLRPPEPPTRV